MSTTEQFISPQDVDLLVADSLSSDWLFTYGDEGREIGLAPYITFYIHHHDESGYMQLVRTFEEIYNTFESTIIDEPFAVISKGDDWLRAGDPLLAQTNLEKLALQRRENLHAMNFGATDEESNARTARWTFMARVTPYLWDGYATLKLSFRLKWYRQNQDKWHTFVKDCLHRLTPEHCYSGFEVGNGDFNILGSFEADVLERVLSDRLYGMDIDHASKMGYHHFGPNEFRSLSILGAGIRTPTWCFMLSPYWQAKLGKTEAEIRTELNDPRIVITAINYPKNTWNPQGRPGLWIRLGELDFYPVEKGVPELLAKANRLIRSIRCDYLNLLSQNPWDDHLRPRFDYEDSIRWMRRFDSHSDWPNLETRLKHTPAEKQQAALRCAPGERVPQSGLWWTPAIKGADGQRQFEAGQHFPDTQHIEWEAVVWYLDQ
jgi:hypothetical protein